MVISESEGGDFRTKISISWAPVGAKHYTTLNTQKWTEIVYIHCLFYWYPGLPDIKAPITGNITTVINHKHFFMESLLEFERTKKVSCQDTFICLRLPKCGWTFGSN